MSTDTTSSARLSPTGSEAPTPRAPLHEPAHVHTARCCWDLHQARWSCELASGVAPGPRPRTEPGAPSVPEQPLVDVRDMVVVHTALLRELRLAPGAVRGIADGDHARARTVARHLRLVLDLLHHHHEGEDELLWPPLRARTTADAAALLDEGEEQHADLDAEIGAVRTLLQPWSRTGSTHDGEALAHHLGHLHVLLAEHLDLEERALLPLAAALLTQAEWDAVGQAGAAAVRKADLPLVFGMFAYEGDPAVVRQMLGAAPRAVRTVLPALARSAYARRARQVHGTARP